MQFKHRMIGLDTINLQRSNRVPFFTRMQDIRMLFKGLQTQRETFIQLQDMYRSLPVDHDGSDILDVLKSLLNTFLLDLRRIPPSHILTFVQGITDQLEWLRSDPLILSILKSSTGVWQNLSFFFLRLHKISLSAELKDGHLALRNIFNQLRLIHDKANDATSLHLADYKQRHDKRLAKRRISLLRQLNRSRKVGSRESLYIGVSLDSADDMSSDDACATSDEDGEARPPSAGVSKIRLSMESILSSRSAGRAALGVGRIYCLVLRPRVRWHG